MSDRSGSDLEWRSLVVRAGLDPDDPFSYKFSGARLEQLADEFQINNPNIKNIFIDREDPEVLVVLPRYDAFVDQSDPQVLNILF